MPTGIEWLNAKSSLISRLSRGPDSLKNKYKCHFHLIIVQLKFVERKRIRSSMKNRTYTSEEAKTAVNFNKPWSASEVTNMITTTHKKSHLIQIGETNVK